jgi:tRNA A37 threonylcarbamoyladenosine dehydratase
MSENIQPQTIEHKGTEAYLEAGADYVISSIDELKELIRMINSRLIFRKKPED